MAIVLVALGHHAIEGELDIERGLSRREPGAVRDPEDVGIDGDGRLAEGDVEHDIRRLAADAGKGDERLAIVRHLAVELLDELPRQRDQVPRLAAIEPDGLDLVGELRLAERDQSLRRIGRLEQVRRRLVDRGVGSLRRQHHGDEEGEGIGVMKLGLGVRAHLGKTPENLLDFRRGEARARRFAVVATPRLGRLAL